MPTAATDTYSRDRLVPVIRPEEATKLHVQLATGTYAKGTLLGEVTATPGIYAAYNNANANGTETARCILEYAVTVDGSGNISALTDRGATTKSTPAYRGGTFLTTDLVGLDAAAITDLGAHLIQGTVANGVLVIPQ